MPALVVSSKALTRRYLIAVAGGERILDQVRFNEAGMGKVQVWKTVDMKRW